MAYAIRTPPPSDRMATAILNSFVDALDYRAMARASADVTALLPTRNAVSDDTADVDRWQTVGLQQEREFGSMRPQPPPGGPPWDPIQLLYVKPPSPCRQTRMRSVPPTLLTRLYGVHDPPAAAVKQIVIAIRNCLQTHLAAAQWPHNGPRSQTAA